jgi:hypothetical protein
MLGLMVYFLSRLIPQMTLYTDVILRSLAITVIFASGVLLLNLSEEGMMLFKKTFGIKGEN